MTNKINIAELLRDCPKGMELDCTIFDNVTFERVTHGGIWINYINNKNYKYEIYLDNEGCLPVSSLNLTTTKCVIFPKGKTTWEGFQRPFQDGDILTNERGSIFIYKGPMYYNKLLSDFYCGYRVSDGAFVPKLFKDKHFGDISECRFATEKEKQKLFTIIRENGYNWDPATKILEKVIEPKFKVGDRIKNGKKIATIEGTHEHLYDIRFDSGGGFRGGEIGAFTIDQQDEWELFPNKFDINTLVPFESKVLVRSGDSLSEWKPAIFGIYRSKYNNFYVVGGTCWKHCIPYEGNEHLLGTTNDCDEYFKSWNS